MVHYYLENDLFEINFPFTFNKTLLKESGFEVHTHDYSEMVIIISGKGVHTVKDTEYPVKMGDVFVVKNFQRHSFSHCTNLGMYNIGFKNELLVNSELQFLPGIKTLFGIEAQTRNTGTYTGKFHVTPLQLEIVKGYLIEMEDEINKRRNGYLIMFSTLFTSILVKLGRYYTDKGFLPSGAFMKMASCVSELEQFFEQKIILKDLAERNGYSLSHFIRYFRRYYKTSPLQYIIQLRISHAVSLMENSDLSISEIGYQSGFDDSNYFSRVFKKRMGISPMNYRRKVAKSK